MSPTFLFIPDFGWVGELLDEWGKKNPGRGNIYWYFPIFDNVSVL